MRALNTSSFWGPRLAWHGGVMAERARARVQVRCEAGGRGPSDCARKHVRRAGGVPRHEWRSGLSPAPGAHHDWRGASCTSHLTVSSPRVAPTASASRTQDFACFNLGAQHNSKDPRAKLQSDLWCVKLLLWLALVVAMFWLPNSFFEAAAWVFKVTPERAR